VPIDHRSNTLRLALRPERRPVWELRLTWLPLDAARTYGTEVEDLYAALGEGPRAGHVPLFLHPQAPATHRRATRRFESVRLAGVWVTPTASGRTVLVWRAGGQPILLKLSLGAIVGRMRRALRESQIARSTLVSAAFAAIPEAHRQALGFDWFPEPAGCVLKDGEQGWLLRRAPTTGAPAPGAWLCPAFSLIAQRGAADPLLVELIRRSGRRPESFVIERLLVPYVSVIGYLLLEQGLEYEGHPQNVLFEMRDDEGPTGRLFLRDLTDTTLNIPLRLAKGHALPAFPPGAWPSGTPFPVVSVASGHRNNAGRSWLSRARDTVERYGLAGFVWAVNTSLARFFPSYAAVEVNRRYLSLWQEAAITYLNVRPLLRDEPTGLPINESVVAFLRHTDWRGLGAAPGASLPESAEALLIDGRQRRRSGFAYERLESAWGDLYLDRGLPAFLRPAF
jgi:hypothetical protein